MSWRHATRAQTLYGRLDATIAVRFPFIWRTRAWLWTAAGLAIALVAHTLGRTLEIRRETLPTLGTIGAWLAVAEFLLFAAFFMIVVDVRRRTRAVVVFAQRLRVIACALVVAVIFLLLPIRAFVLAMVPRIAALESEEKLRLLLELHEPHDFWNCKPNPQALELAIEGKRSAIAGDLERYGLVTDFEIISMAGPPCTGSESSARLLIQTRSERKHFSDFGGRLRNVQAAHHYIRGKSSRAYEPLFAFLPVATLTAVLSLVGNGRRSLWPHVRVVLDRVSRRLWTFRWQAQLENFLGASFPTVFSAKLHAVPASFAILAGSLALAASLASNTQMLAGLMMLTSLYFVLRGQETIRHHPAFGLSDHFVLLLHGLCLFGIAAAGVTVFGDWSTLSTAHATAVVWLGLSCCAAMQAARSTSALAAFGGLVGAYALMITLILGYSVAGITRETGFTAFGTLAILLTLLVSMLKRRGGGSAFARVLFTTALVLTPSFGMTGALLVLDPGFDVELMTNFVLGVALFGLLAISIGLWMTTSLRRAIATAR